MRIRILLLLAAATLVLAGICYHLGRRDGSAGARAAATAAALRVNAGELAALAPKIAAAMKRKTVDDARRDTARVVYVAARSRIHIVDTTSLQVDGGPPVQLPTPVIQTIARADTLAARDSIDLVSTRAWGQLWKAKAELLEQRVGLLQEQLDDEHRAKWLDRAKAVALGVVLGAGAVAIAH